MKWLRIFVLISLVMVACTNRSPEPTETPTPTDEPTATTVEETDTPEPSATPTDEPTETPTPTRKPTNTPAATETSTEASVSAPAATDDGGSGTESSPEPGQTPTGQVEPTAETPETSPVGEIDLVPDGNSVWQLDTEPSSTATAEECAGPLTMDFYGMVAVEKVGNGVITWLIPAGTKYTLQRTAGETNVYWGRGDFFLDDYFLTISVVFTSPESLGVTYVLVQESVEGCNHVWQYGGFRAW